MALSETYLAETIRRMLDVRLLTVLTGANPAAGADILVTVPAGEYWELVSLEYRLVSSAVVANRRSILIIDDGTNEVVRYGSNGNHAASSSVMYTFTSGGVFNQSAITGSACLIGFGEQMLFPGWRLRTTTDNFDVGDDYTAPTLMVRRFSPDDLANYAADVENELRATQTFATAIE